MIKLQIIGNLGKDSMVKEVNGKNVINFSVAHTERFKTREGKTEDRTTWVECAYWTDKTAVADYLKKGQLVYVEGAPWTDGYLNKDNAPSATLRLRVQNIQLLGNRNGENNGSNQGNVSNAESQPRPTVKADMDNGGESDDLPF